MKFPTSFIALAGLTVVVAQTNNNFPYLNHTTIHQPKRGVEEYIYPRYVELSSGTILVTVSRTVFSGGSGGGPPPANPAEAYFPVFSSSDGGVSWDYISNITDQVNGRGLGAQPALTQPTEQIGEYPAGTVLAAGNSWSGEGTRIDVYASSDEGHTWKFVSQVAQGGPPNTTNGATPIFGSRISLAFYSDQRDPLHGQKLSHQVSSDLKTWGPVVNDVAYPTYADRPGMTIVARLPTGDWILVHEYPGGYTLGLAQYPVYYHIAPTPLEFITDPGRPIIADGFQPSSSPYVVWSSVGGVNGTIVVSDADHSGVFLNTMLGDSTGWRYHETDFARASYSRALAIWSGQPNKLAIFSAATFNDGAKNLSRPLSLTVEDLEVLVQNNVPPNVTPLEIYYPGITKLAAS